MDQTPINYEKLADKPYKDDYEILLLVCEFIRKIEKKDRDREDAWNEMVEYLENEGYKVK